jgi:hypothetical protein
MPNLEPAAKILVQPVLPNREREWLGQGRAEGMGLTAIDEGG